MRIYQSKILPNSCETSPMYKKAEPTGAKLPYQNDHTQSKPAIARPKLTEFELESPEFP